MPTPSEKSAKSGQVYIGLIISLGILAILSQTIFTLVFASYDILNFTSARTTAKHIASEQMEIIRNLPFNSVGTIGGIPSGTLSQSQITNRNGLNYTITTSIVYIDDTFDQIAPDDLLPTDYKRVRVDVSWGGLAASKSAPVTLISDIAPKGVETTTGGGTLSILVFDSAGTAVPQAQIHIVASSVVPPVDLTLQTANNGRVILPGAPACNSCYEITTTKSSYSTDRTYSSSEVANPIKRHQTILADELTEVSFSIDLVSTLAINSTSDRQSGFAALPNQPFRLQSNKIIGTTALDEPVYKYDEDLTTDATGTRTLPNMEWDTYTFTPLNETTYDVSGINTLLPITLLPNTSQSFKYSSTIHSSHTLLALFTDATSNRIASVSAQLLDAGTPIATVSSGLLSDPDFGQSFFANLLSKTYQLEATASGYATYSGTVDVNGQSSETVILTP